MKTIKIFVFLLLTVLISCREPIPETYGVYVVNDDELTRIEAQETAVRGNLLNSISGVKAASGACFNQVTGLFVFEKDVDPNNIILSKLKFNEGTTLKNFWGNSFVRVNLWTSEEAIDIGISPVQGNDDMYKIIPEKPLDSGFYALHFGCLTNKDTPVAFNKTAFDFVVGSSTAKYRSAEEINQSKEIIFYQEAQGLLILANNYFNTQNYAELRGIYKQSDGNRYSDADWDQKVEGFRNWNTQAGNIKLSKIDSQIIGENEATFYLKTVYENLGVVDEELRITRIKDKFFITFIGSN